MKDEFTFVQTENELSPAIEAGLKAPELTHQAHHIQEALESARENRLTDILAENLVTSAFVHIKKDPSVSGEYVSLLKVLSLNHNNVRRILIKSVTKKGRCPDAARTLMRKALYDVERELSPKLVAPPPRKAEVSLSRNLIPFSNLAQTREIEAPVQIPQNTTFSLIKVLSYDYNPLGSTDSLVPEAIRSYQESLAIVRDRLVRSAEEYTVNLSTGVPDTIASLIAHAKQYNQKSDHEFSDRFTLLAAAYSQTGREDLFKIAAAQYCFGIGKSLFESNQRKESRPYFQVFLHIYGRSRSEIQRELTWKLFHTISYIFGSYNIYVYVRDSAPSDIAEKFYTNLNKAFLEMGRQRQFQSLGRSLVDIALAFPYFLTDYINRLKTRGETSILLLIQKSLMIRPVFLAEPLICFNMLSRIDVGNIADVLNRTLLSSADDRRLVSRALIKYSLDSNRAPHEILRGFAQQASSDTKSDLAFAVFVESLNPNLLAKGNELKASLLAETIGFPRGTEMSEYFLARADELANLFHQFSRTSNPNLKGRYGYSILETVRLTRKWTVDRLKGDLRKEAIRFYRTVEGYVTTEQSKLIRDTNLEFYLASGRAVYSPASTRITLEVRNVGEGTADGLELEVLPIEGKYDVEERFRTYAIDILSDKTPVQREVFIRPLVSENESIEFNAVLRYNTLNQKNKTAKLDEQNRTVWLYPETQFVRVPQPYNIGEPATTWFYGRHNLLETMADNLHSENVHDVSMIVYGLKRAGKTSVVKRFLEHTLKNESLDEIYIPIYADIQKDPIMQSVKGDGEFLYYIISVINDNVSAQPGIKKLNLPSFKDEFNSNPFETFAFLLDELLGLVAPRRILIALDEFSTLQSKLDVDNGIPVLSNSLFGFISNTMQATNQLTLIFTGTYMLLDMMREHTFDLAKICMPYMVGFLDDSAARQLVTEPLKRDAEKPSRGWLEYDPRVIEQIVTITNKHPFLIQYLCMQVVNRMNELKHNSVNLNDITSIVADVVNRPMHAPIMHTLWNEFDPPQHKVLSAIAYRSNPAQEWVDVDEIMYTFKEFGDGSSEEDVLAICSSLSDAELLEKSSLGDSEAYKVTIPLYQLWLKQNKPPRSAFLS